MMDTRGMSVGDDQYSDIFSKNLSVMLLIRPDDGQVLDANPAACLFYGWTHDEMVLKNIGDINILSHDKIKEEMNRAVVEERKFFSFIHRRADDSRRNVDVYSSPIQLEGQTVLFSIVHDATDKKIVADKLFSESDRLQNIVLSTRVGTWEWNIQTGETIFNERWAEIIGYTLDELATVSIKTWEAHAHPDDLKQSNKLLEEHFLGNRPYYEFESRMKHKDGSWVWVIDRGRVMSHTSDGKPLMMFGTHSDISQRKLSEELLGRIGAQNKIIFEQSPIAIELYDSNGLLVRVNQACLDLFGIKDIEEVRKFSLFDDPNVSEDRKNELKQGKCIHYEAPFDFGKVTELHLYETSKFGQILLEINITPVLENALITGYLLQIQDITKRLEAEEIIQKKLNELNKMNDLMIGR